LSTKLEEDLAMNTAPHRAAPRRTSLLVACVLAAFTAGESLRAQTPTDSWACQADRVFEGSTVNTHLGASVCSPARWNADADPDFLFGGTGQLEVPTINDSAADVDRAYLHFGPAQTALDSSPDLTFEGVGAHDRFGWSVTYFGYIDGDGKSEIAIGAPRGPKVDGIWQNRGRVYIYLSADGNIPVSGTVSASSASLILEPQTEDGFGNIPARRFGFSVASAGDVDGDGKGDLAVGAPGTTANGLAGRVYIYYGQVLQAAKTAPVDPPLQVLSAEAYARLIQEGDSTESANDRLGYSVACAGDVDGDGMPDVIAGAPQYFLDVNQAVGQGYALAITSCAINGGSNCQNTYRVPTSPATWLATGDAFGFSVAGGQDFDGDSLADVVVGAPRRTVTGVEKVGSAFVMAVWTDTRLHDVHGSGASSHFGWSVVAMASVDGEDSLPDFAVGAKLATRDTACISCTGGLCDGTFQGGNAVGRVYIHRGGVNLLGTPPLLARITGQTCRDRLGYSLAVAGNLGGDSRPDLLTGAVGYPYTGDPTERGRVYLLFTPTPASSSCSTATGCAANCQ
jgi:FG-GAP repeat